MSDQTDKLLPCAFCGGPTRIESSSQWHDLVCDHDKDCVLDGDSAEMSYLAKSGPEVVAQMVAKWNRRATPAPQAAPSDAQVAEICHSVRPDDHKTPGTSFDVDYLTYDGAVVRAYLAAAPTVAITQAATQKCFPDSGMFCTAAKCCEEATNEPVAGHRLCARLGGVCTCNDRETLTCALLEHAAPVAHLAGTTPNTEAPSEPTEVQMAAACKAYSDFPAAPDAIAAKTWMQDRLRATVRAALSAQQAGVQEAPCEDANQIAHEVCKNMNPAPNFYVLRDAIRAALAAATQTEKK